MEVLPGIHRIEAPLGDRYVALYLIVGDDATLLVDTGLDESIRSSLIPYMASIGHQPKRVHYVVNTHADFDHMGGNRAVRELCPEALLLCGASDREQIEDIEVMIEDRYGEFRRHGFDETPETKDFIRQVAHTFPVDGCLRAGDVIDLGGRSLEVLEVPGHSPGYIGLYEPEQRVALIGDAVLWSTVLTAAGDPAFPPTYRDLPAYRNTIRQTLDLAPEFLLTAHYRVMSGGGVQEFLRSSQIYTDLVETVITDVLDAAREPVTLLEIIERGRDRLGPWPAEAAQYLVYPVLGHLENLAARGLVVGSSNSAGTPRFEIQR